MKHLFLRAHRNAELGQAVMRFWTIVCIIVLIVFWVRYPEIWTGFASWFFHLWTQTIQHPHPYKINPGVTTTVVNAVHHAAQRP
jgi:hypothetical protein